MSELEDCDNGDGIIATGRHPKFRSSLSLSQNTLLLAWCRERWRWRLRGRQGGRDPEAQRRLGGQRGRNRSARCAVAEFFFHRVGEEKNLRENDSRVVAEFLVLCSQAKYGEDPSSKMADI